MRLAPRATLLFVVLYVAGCGPALRWEEPPPSPPGAAPRVAAQPAEHVVRAGETLYSIAFRYGLDVQTLARWNQLGDGSLIRVGQRLRLSPPGPGSPGLAGPVPSAPTLPPPRWLWPTGGDVIRAYGDTRQTQSGIHIGGRRGQSVMAAADGQVVYAGSGLVGYGELVIVKHNETWLTAYGYNQELLVAEGEGVRAGQAIARMGEGPGRQPALHFEIRQNGVPVDPARYLTRPRL